jgi:predicted NBD/HSP70 family sugar kinase
MDERMSIRTPSRTADLRHINRARVLAGIRRTPGISRRQLARLTSLTEASLSRIARDLIDAGLVQEMEAAGKASQRGRPEVGLFLNPDQHYVLAVCLSTYEHKLSLISIAGERLWEGEISFSSRSTAEGLLQHVAGRLEEAGSGPDLRLKRPLGIAFALSDTGALGQKLMQELADQSACASLAMPVCVANLTSALHLAEADSALRGPASNSLLIHAGLDLGATLIIDGILRQHASDLDHAGRIAVLEQRQDGARAIRMLADVASGKAILAGLGSGNAAHGRSGVQSGMPHAIRQANSGDPKAVEIFAHAGEVTALAYAGTASLIRLEHIILAGPLAAAAPFMRAFCHVFETIFEDQPDAGPIIYRSRISDLKAAEHLALISFVFGPQMHAAIPEE